MRNKEVEDQLKAFGMQNLMLESDLAKLENSGIELGHIKKIKKEETVDTELFEHDILQEAKKMADFYILYYCMENTVRRLISERLEEKYGQTWWDTKVPAELIAGVKAKQIQEKDTPFTIRSEDPLSYSNFGELIVIIDKNWDDFSDTIRSRKSMKETLSKLSLLRNVIAHSCYLNDDEILRFKLLIKDWQRIQM